MEVESTEKSQQQVSDRAWNETTVLDLEEGEWVRISPVCFSQLPASLASFWEMPAGVWSWDKGMNGEEDWRRRCV